MKLADVQISVRLKLSALWASVMFCYVYGDFADCPTGQGRAQALVKVREVVRFHSRTPMLQLFLFVVCLVPCALRCASVAQVTTLSDPACHQTLTDALEKIMEAEGETAPVAEQLAAATATALQVGDLGPRPFLVAASSGVDYSFFVERKGASCVLRLYGRQKGFVSYTNNLTYIATEPLAPCQCAE